MTFDKLTQFALLGTARSAWTPAPVDDATLQSSLAVDQTGNGPEDQLLATAAILSAYEACGASPAAPTAATVAEAPPDGKPACSARAATLLEHILALTNTSTKQQLLAEWLTSAARVGQRVGHALLPTLLDYGAATRAVRPLIEPVMDQRGHWLASLNPRWQFTAGGTDTDTEKLWSTGNREQRTATLRALRETNPEAARQIVQSTWKEDGADERASFVEAMRVGLGAADEPFLEAALDDRSKGVRAAAAELLQRLPESALVARMIARVEPLMKFTPAGAAKALRKAKPAAIDIELPPDKFDPAWARDGVIEKPAGRVGKRQGWVTQMLGAVPPSHWSKSWKLSPAECVAAATGDYVAVLIGGWTAAAERYNDAQWIETLLIHSLDEGPGRRRMDLLKHLPADRQRGILKTLLASKLEADALRLILDSICGQLDATIAPAVIEAVEHQATSGGANYNYALAGMLESLAHCLPTDAYDALVKRWTGPKWEANRKAVDSFFRTLQMRQKIKTEFAQ